MLRSLTLNIGSKLIVVVSQFIALSLVNHIVGPEGRGIFTSASTWSTFFFTMFHLSLSTGIFFMAGKNPDNIFKLAKTSVVFAGLMGIVVCIVASGFFFAFPSIINIAQFKYLLLAYLVIPFMMLQTYSLAIVQVKGRFGAFNTLYSCYAIVNLLVIIGGFFFYTITLDLLFYSNLIAWAITGLLSMLFLTPLMKGVKIDTGFLKFFFRSSLTAHFGALVTFAVNRSDVLMLNYFTDNKVQVGVYTLASGFVQILLIVPLSMQNLLYYQLIGKERENQTKILLRFSRLVFTCMVIASIIVWIISPLLVDLLGGKGFESAVPLFKYFLPGIVFYSMPVIFAAQWNLMGLFKQVNLASVSILVLSIVGNAILIPYLGTTGGAITFLIMAFFAFCIHLRFVQRYLGRVSLNEILLVRISDIKSAISGRIQ